MIISETTGKPTQTEIKLCENVLRPLRHEFPTLEGDGEGDEFLSNVADALVSKDIDYDTLDAAIDAAADFVDNPPAKLS